MIVNLFSLWIKMKYCSLKLSNQSKFCEKKKDFSGNVVFFRTSPQSLVFMCEKETLLYSQFSVFWTGKYQMCWILSSHRKIICELLLPLTFAFKQHNRLWHYINPLTLLYVATVLTSLNSSIVLWVFILLSIFRYSD